ncbi:SAF domain-containing protein [Paenibacillus sp. L3-i20]|uniref:SAF domain-containing protein n=1 Tax=Paenibacillus sp. L3-i20 TaxID=2905833 RepID=UPI001EDEB22D|nr:SAF domain-containing protein [Paenibacillus sp. L3-i20]GKU77563.1 hypothetical protein L3i20_v219600 [Paenibacillus sp. L3-i20]
MNIEWNFKTIAIMAAAVVLFIGTNVGQYYVIWKPKINDMKVSYEERIAVLDAELQRIGPIVSVWAIKDEAEDMFAGRQITQDDLMMRELPESFVTQSLVLNPETILGKYYRIGMLPGTLLSTDMVMEDPLDDTIREYDVVASVMPIGLKVGDYIDYRIIYPLGEDYIVLPHKRVEAIHDKTIKLKMSETEIHYYQAALIDFFLQSKNGATLYLTKYLEPGIQKAATPYYAVPKNILAIMTANPNILETLNGSINDQTRKIIDAGNANVTQEVGGDIAQGRGEVSGKIDAGETEFNNLEEELREAAEQAALAEGEGLAPSEPTAPSAEPDAGVTPSDPSLPANPILEIEKGVVE